MRYFIIICVFFTISCKKNSKILIKDYRLNTNITALCRFPDTVKVGESNVASYIFVNSIFDTIIAPRVKDPIKYRFMLFSEYYPENISNFNQRIYADSILLDKNKLDLNYEFDEEGTYFIGGLIRDELYYDYSFIKSDSLIKYATHKVVSKKVIVVR